MIFVNREDRENKNKVLDEIHRRINQSSIIKFKNLMFFLLNMNNNSKISIQQMRRRYSRFIYFRKGRQLMENIWFLLRREHLNHFNRLRYTVWSTAEDTFLQQWTVFHSCTLWYSCFASGEMSYRWLNLIRTIQQAAISREISANLKKNGKHMPIK